MINVCFVCLGNICRSPTAEGVLLSLVQARGLQDRIAVESAGTAAYHLGERPDRRALQHARQRGIELPSRAQQFQSGDFERFDYVLAMDTSNLEHLRRLARKEQAGKLQLLLDFHPDSPPGSSVPDPYYGGAEGFETVLDLCQRACEGLLQSIVERHGLA
jgi:protein-tyrosine phosphatase